MIIDLGKAKTDPLPVYDLCIVGSGPAGLTVANELATSGLRLCVLESGQFKFTKHGDQLRQVKSAGIRIKDYSRERAFGGASTTWAGLASPLDPVDFRTRPFLRHSGWPISREDLLPYYEKATQDYGFASLKLFGTDGFRDVKAGDDRAFAWTNLEEKTFLAAANPQHFGRMFRSIFTDSQPGVDLYLNATLIRLEPDPSAKGQRITHGIIRTSTGHSTTIEATVFIIATGGIENARILLNSRDGCPAELGNEHDQVGRYLMNHPKDPYGLIHLREPLHELPYYFGCLYQGYAGYGGIRLKEHVQSEQGCLNTYVRFEPLFPWSDNRGVESLIFLVKRSTLLFETWKARAKERIVSLRDYAETGDDSELQNDRKTWWDWIGLFGAITANFPMVLRYVLARLQEGAHPTIRVIRMRNFMEMEPDPENRVVLSDETDVYGQPVPSVYHQTTALDRKSLITLHQTLAAEVTQMGFGELSSELETCDPWPITYDASHHLGTTRMGTDPKTSVVTPDCRLHSIENVYVAGASVFPTSGCANPTFTIVALAIRLAEHLREQVFGDKEG